MSCLPPDIDPTSELNDIANEILSVQETLTELYAELMDRAENLGLVDEEDDLLLVDEKLSKLVEAASIRRLTIFNISSIMGDDYPSWHEQYAQPQKIHWKRDGNIDVTLITGETFTEIRNGDESTV